MPTMREQVVSKVRQAAKGLSAMQKRLLADAKANGSQWKILDRDVPGVYCVFRRGRCLYVGESTRVVDRIMQPQHPTAKIRDRVVCYIALPASVTKRARLDLEMELTCLLMPSTVFTKSYLRQMSKRNTKPGPRANGNKG